MHLMLCNLGRLNCIDSIELIMIDFLIFKVLTLNRIVDASNMIDTCLL